MAINKSIVNEDKELKFLEFLYSTSLLDTEKSALKYLIDYFKGIVPKKFSSTSYLITGDPGIGKTYLVEKLLDVFRVPVLYTGPKINNPNITVFADIVKLSRNIGKYDSYIVFIDDLGHIIKYDDPRGFDGISFEHKQAIIAILETIKKTDKMAALIVTTNNRFVLDEAMYDRIEVKIEMDAPSEENKRYFLNKSYSRLLKEKEISYLAKNCIGYNFRDIPEVVKIAFREGNKKITIDSIDKSLKNYKPSSMTPFQVINNIQLNFNDVIGKDNIKKVAKRIKFYLSRKNFCKKMGMKRPNLLIFYGPPGTGKTFFAKALAGELGLPIVKVDAMSFSQYGFLGSMHVACKIVKRFNNSILFIDEADKLLARGTFDEDSIPQSYMNDLFDGIQDSNDSMVILSLNDLNRFGNAFIDRFSCIKFDYPNQQERCEFLGKKIAKSKLNIDADIKSFARMTNNMSYREIEKIWNELMYDILENRPVDENVIRSTIIGMKKSNENSGMFG